MVQALLFVPGITVLCHCTRHNIAATTRASLTFYNDTTDIDRLIIGIKQAEEIFNG